MTESDRESIQTEIEILKLIEHPNIIKLFDVFEDEKYICLVIELMEGGELFDLINEQKRFSEDQAREIVKNLIDSIQYCHQLGIVHRDIKPENLLF
jgi:serine/threonine protein kinase